MAAYLFSIIWPVALHMILSDFSAIVLAAATGRTPDSAPCTTLAAILVIPPALWMYHGDRKHREFAGDRREHPFGQDAIRSRKQGFGRKKEKASEIRTDGEAGLETEKETGKYKKMERTRQERNRNTVRGFSGKSVICRVLIGIACFVSGGILDHIWSQVLLWLRVQDYFSNQTQERLLASQFAVQIIGLGILVPVAEELIFRGLVYARIRRRLPVWTSILLASAIFALYHGNMIQILFAFPMAVILSLLYEKGRWMGCPILFHMGVNLTTVVLTHV